MKPSPAIALLNKAAFFAVMLPIAGCAVPPPEIVEDVELQFKLSGKAVIYQAQKTDSFNLIWQREKSPAGLIDTVWVKDKLGGTKARLENTPDEARLKIAKKSWRADNAEALSDRLLGFSLPVQAIGFWLTGNPDPAHSSHRDIDFIEQLGWEVRYESYFDDGTPKRIKFRFKKGKALLVIKKWQPPV